MKIWIPKCGDAIKLDQDWTFNLETEYRNADLVDALDGKPQSRTNRYNRSGNRDVTFATDTQLVFDRIYIRQDSGDYTSVTFMIKEHTNLTLVGERFWVKLGDANKIEATYLSSDHPVGGFAKQRYKSELKARLDPAVKAMQEATKQAKKELETAREACGEEVQANNAGPIAFHVDRIISDVVGRANNNGSYSYGGRDRGSIRHEMICGSRYARRGSQQVWTIESTKKDAIAGLTIRNIRFFCDGAKFGGFTVTSKGAEVVNIAPLV